MILPSTGFPSPAAHHRKLHLADRCPRLRCPAQPIRPVVLQSQARPPSPTNDPVNRVAQMADQECRQPQELIRKESWLRPLWLCRPSRPQIQHSLPLEHRPPRPLFQQSRPRLYRLARFPRSARRLRPRIRRVLVHLLCAVLCRQNSPEFRRRTLCLKLPRCLSSGLVRHVQNCSCATRLFFKKG